MVFSESHKSFDSPPLSTWVINKHWISYREINHICEIMHISIDKTMNGGVNTS